MHKLKAIYKTDSEKEALSKIDYSSANPEILKARLLKGKMDLVIEFSDTFSWFCAVLLKLNEIIESEKLPIDIESGFDIEEELKSIYKSPNKTAPLVCYACKQKSCKCLFYPKTN
jgi:hypothetical protein